MRARYAVWMKRLYWVCIWVAGLSLLAMTMIVPWGVFARYVLGTGSAWPEPLAILLMVLFTFVAAAASYRAGAHIAVTMFVSVLPPRARHRAAVVVDGLLALLSLFMLVWGVQLVAATMHQVIAEFPFLRVGFTYMAVPLGGLLTLAFIAEHLWCGPAADLAEPEEVASAQAEAS